MRPWRPTAGMDAEHRRLTGVARAMEQRFAEKRTAEDLAALSGLSVRQFRRVFARVFRVGPMQHLARVRIRAACSRLAATDDSLSEIALDCCFYDQSHFCNQFRRIKGVSPSAYRQRFRPR